MESLEKAGHSGSLDDKPSIVALVNASEFRRSLKRITEMSEAERKRYSARFMREYQDPLTEVGWTEASFGYRIAEIVLSTMCHAIFDKSY